MPIKVSISDEIGCSQNGESASTDYLWPYLGNVRTIAGMSFSGMIFLFHLYTVSDAARIWMTVHGDHKYLPPA